MSSGKLPASNPVAIPVSMVPAVQGSFVHHVYFWLNRPDSEEDRAALVAGLRALSASPAIRAFHIGLPAATDRPVVDRSYSVSWMILFDSAEDQDRYQDDPFHHQFKKNCSPLWKRSVVYDSLAVD
jgi:hypothetical protein